MKSNNIYIKNREELAENLRFLREQSGLSQQQVAKKLFMDRSTYAYYESAKVEPNIFTLIRLAEIYNVSFNVFISAKGP